MPRELVTVFISFMEHVEPLWPRQTSQDHRQPGPLGKLLLNYYSIGMYLVLLLLTFATGLFINTVNTAVASSSSCAACYMRTNVMPMLLLRLLQGLGIPADNLVQSSPVRQVNADPIGAWTLPLLPWLTPHVSNDRKRKY